MKKSSLFLVILLGGGVAYTTIQGGLFDNSPLPDGDRNALQGARASLGSLPKSGSSLPADFGMVPDSVDAELAQFTSLVEQANAEDSQTPLDKQQARQTAQSALTLLRSAAQRGDQRFLEQVSKLGPQCSWCDEFYKETRAQFAKRELSLSEQGFIARVLARSGRSDNARELYQDLKHSVADTDNGGQPGIASQALEETKLPPDVVDSLSAELSSANPYVREAAVSILTKQSSLEAATKLYNHTLERKDPLGYYHSGIGLAFFTPQGEAVPYIESLALQQDEYSPLAIRSLLNMGKEGLDRVDAIMRDINDYAGSKRLLSNTVDHIGMDPQSIARAEQLAQNASNKALREVAQEFVRERKEDQNLQNREIEFNENTYKGFVTP